MGRVLAARTGFLGPSSSSTERSRWRRNGAAREGLEIADRLALEGFHELHSTWGEVRHRVGRTREAVEPTVVRWRCTCVT